MPFDRWSLVPDETLALLREGYRFIGNRCRDGAHAYATRLMLRPTICVTGPEAARLFYDESRFSRRNAAPRRVRRTLLGEGGVQGLDDEAHKHRKALFLQLTVGAPVEDLVERSRAGLDAAFRRWAREDEPIVLLDAVSEVLCGAVCGWAGVPLEPGEVGPLTRDLLALIDAGNGLGARYLRGRLARVRRDRWAIGRIRWAREHRAPSDRALGAIAHHRDLGDQPLDEATAAVELLNVLRPTVAIGRFVAFAAHALHVVPEARAFVRDDPGHVRPFVQEVRRFYPFFPFAAARVRRALEFEGLPFREGVRVLLDLYGTDHDPAVWPEPEEFRLDRFLRRDPTPFDLVPQGGGDVARHHRCAGEEITIALMEVAVDRLANRLRYRVPEQDLSIDLARMPARPRTGVVIDRIAA